VEEELKLAKADKSIVVSCSTLLHWTGFTMLLKRSSFCSFEAFIVQGVSSCNQSAVDGRAFQDWIKHSITQCMKLLQEEYLQNECREKHSALISLAAIKQEAV